MPTPTKADHREARTLARFAKRLPVEQFARELAQGFANRRWLASEHMMDEMRRVADRMNQSTKAKGGK